MSSTDDIAATFADIRAATKPPVTVPEIRPRNKKPARPIYAYDDATGEVTGITTNGAVLESLVHRAGVEHAIVKENAKPPVIKCIDCGVPVIVKRQCGHLPNRCGPCRDERERQRWRDKKKRERERDREAVNAYNRSQYRLWKERRDMGRVIMQSQSRNIESVLGDMLGIIPAEETALRAGLERVRRDAPYRPPEAQFLTWRGALDVLITEFGEVAPTEGWRGDVVRVFRGDGAAAREGQEQN